MQHTAKKEGEMVAIAVSLAAEQTYAKLHPELELSSATHSQKNKQARRSERALVQSVLRSRWHRAVAQISGYKGKSKRRRVGKLCV